MLRAGAPAQAVEPAVDLIPDAVVACHDPAAELAGDGVAAVVRTKVALALRAVLALVAAAAETSRGVA